MTPGLQFPLLFMLPQMTLSSQSGPAEPADAIGCGFMNLCSRLLEHLLEAREGSDDPDTTIVAFPVVLMSERPEAPPPIDGLGFAIAPPAEPRLDPEPAPGSVVDREPGLADPAASIARATGGQTDLPPRPPVRVHAEWHGQDVSVWLGVDRHAQQSDSNDLPALISRLQVMLSDQGYRLSYVVRNGRSEYCLGSDTVSELRPAPDIAAQALSMSPRGRQRDQKGRQSEYFKEA